jgi:GT2 family glycosyltransferase
MTIDAIVLSKTGSLNHYGISCRTINSLQASREWGGKTIVVESMTESHLQENGFIYNNCDIIFPEMEFNYNKFLNIGIKASTADWVLLCNNDIYFYKNWLVEMKKAIFDYKDIKSFSPISPTWHLHQGLESGCIVGYEVSKHICGWCILVRKDVVESCDLFDENFKFWYQDNDYSLTLKKNNIKHGLVTSSRVEHYISKSYDLLGDTEIDMTHGQHQRFIAKWN